MSETAGGLNMHEYGVICFLNCPVSGTAGRKYPCTFMWHDAFSIVLCLKQQGGGIHVHACGVNLVFNCPVFGTAGRR